MSKKISDILPKTEILAQLAEEASELAQAALKLRRALDGTNPTPKSVEECRKAFEEEYADVMVCIHTLQDVFGQIDIEPTIDPETLRPVAHWEVGGVNPADDVVGNWVCSLCNETSPEDSSFCPYCGAKMEG